MKRPKLVTKTQLISNVTRPTWRISETPRGQSVTSRHVKNCPKTSKNHAKSMGERMAPQDQSSPFLWQIITCLPLRHSSPLPVFTLLPVRNQTPGPVCHTHLPFVQSIDLYLWIAPEVHAMVKTAIPACKGVTKAIHSSAADVTNCQIVAAGLLSGLMMYLG